MSDIQNVISSPEDSEVETKLQSIIEDVNGIIQGYMIEYKIDSLKDITQQQFSAMLLYVATVYFKRNKCLYKYIPGISNNNNIVLMYNDILVCGLCEYYIFLCMNNNKVCNAFGFSMFSGIDDDTLLRWSKSEVENQRPAVFGMTKRLRNMYQISLENGAQSGKNPIGYMAALNHWFGWSQDKNTTVTVNINRDKRQIMSTYGDESVLPDNAES